MQVIGSTEQTKLLGNNPFDIETGNSPEQQLRELNEELERLSTSYRSVFNGWIDQVDSFQKRVHPCLEAIRETANKTDSVSRECLEMANRLEEGSKNLSLEVKRLKSEDRCQILALCGCFVGVLVFFGSFGLIHYFGDG